MLTNKSELISQDNRSELSKSILTKNTVRSDGVTLYGTTTSHELSTKVIGHYDNMSKGDVESVGGEHDGTLLRENKISEETDTYNYVRSPSLHNNYDSKDFVNSDQNEGEVTKLRSLSNHEIGETNSCDKNTMTEFELPETRTGVTDGALQNVKDICIEEGEQSIQKVLVESTDHQNFSHRFNQSVPNEVYDVRENMMCDFTDKIYGIDCISHGLKSSQVNEIPVSMLDKDGAEHCSLKSFPSVGYKSMAALSIKTIREKHLLPVQKFDAEQCQTDFSSSDSMVDKKQLDQVTLEERNSDAKTSSLATEESVQNNKTKGNCGNVEVESGVITFDFDSEEATMNGNDKSIKHTDNKQIGHARYDSKTNATVDSGHILYSGSISNRSDSSTTSACSFAFPVLQPEWNSTPVKMAKADNRHLRRHQSCFMGLLCCKF